MTLFNLSHNLLNSTKTLWILWMVHLMSRYNLYPGKKLKTAEELWKFWNESWEIGLRYSPFQVLNATLYNESVKE